MKPLTILVLVAGIPCISGCVTADHVSTAKGEKCIDESGKVVQVTSRPKPALYALTPFTVTFDVASAPFGVALWIITSVNPFEGMFHPSHWTKDCVGPSHTLEHRSALDSK
jgi:hypothetical protein